MEYIQCLVDSHHGIYIPQVFIEKYKNSIKEESIELEWLENLSSPDNEFYWDSWDLILSNAVLFDKDGNSYWLANGTNGDLFAIAVNCPEEQLEEFFV